MVDYRSGKSHLARSGNSSCPLKKFILPARENIVQIKFLRKLKLIMPCCDDEEHSPSEFYCHGETNDPNATFQGENNAMLQTLFLQHFNGFILHGTFVVYQEIYIIFSKIKFFPFLVLKLFCCYSKCTARNRQYIRLKVVATKVFFGFFYKVRTNCDPTKPYNKSLINLVCSVCTGKYSLRFLSHRPRSFVARSVRNASGNTSDLALG